MNEDTSTRTPFGMPPYKKYVALMTQSGSSAPTAVVLENSIGGIAWTRSSTGRYVGTLTGTFPADKTTVMLTLGQGPLANVSATYGASRVDADSVRILTNDTGSLADSLLTDAVVEIRIYLT